MLGALANRGPDDIGVVRAGPATLGHRRLAILDTSAAGHQPMAGPGGELLLSYNGEIFNFRDVAAELGLDESTLKSRSDTEVLLHAWRRWGPGALERLVGQWAFALYDARSRRLCLVRDRFGEKPLFWHASDERLVFGSSIASICRAPEVPRELDPRAIVEFLTLRYVIAPRTVMREIRKVPPGCWLEFSETGDMRQVQWYSPRFRGTARPRRRSADETAETFGALFGQACRRCLVSDVPVGILLSDGIDSNGIRASLFESGRTPTSFTFRLKDGAPPEVPTGQGGEIVDVPASPGDRWASLQDALSNLTEPVGDGASLATWLLLRGARAFATVFICGHGGDEVFGGYRLSQDRFRLRALRRLAWIRGDLLGRTSERYLNGSDSPESRRSRLRTVSEREAPAAALYMVDRPLPHTEVGSLLGDRWPEDEPYLQTIRRLYDECGRDACDLDRIQEVLMRTFLSENVLSFADGVSMAHSAELRMPFLDRDLVEFALDLSPSERVAAWPGRANTKLPLRRWAKSRLPRAIVTRPKRGFQYGNISDLLRQDGRGLRDRILGARAVRRVVPGVERWLAQFENGEGGPWGGTLWALLVLATWSDAVQAS